MLPATTVCRQATNECDLPEYCDGHMEHCPADFYVQDGHECPNHVDVSTFNFLIFSWKERQPLLPLITSDNVM